MNTKEGRKLLRTLIDFGNLAGDGAPRLFTDKLADPKLRRVSAYVNGGSELQIKSLIDMLEYHGAQDVRYVRRVNHVGAGPSHVRMTCKWEG